MFKRLNFRGKKGQSTLEYAILVIIVIGALLSMQVYIKRGIQGRMKSAADDIGDQFSAGNTNVVKTTKSYSKTNEVTKYDVGTKSTLLATETTNTSSSSNIVTPDTEYWGDNRN